VTLGESAATVAGAGCIVLALLRRAEGDTRQDGFSLSKALADVHAVAGDSA
jgi:hypothetical protein